MPSRSPDRAVSPEEKDGVANSPRDVEAVGGPPNDDAQSGGRVSRPPQQIAAETVPLGVDKGGATSGVEVERKKDNGVRSPAVMDRHTVRPVSRYESPMEEDDEIPDIDLED
ncbi:unnamed protein product [Phytomonas sp. Hart1]|nr:unnamed protein product [Phytomonas sp. Hart1]|eukprot:CCW71808.1 unnamed protein product [Phytomonas sp. isolate Hart1]